MDLQKVETLKARALQAMQGAYAPYSHFRVGAAVLAVDGAIYTGCNIENSAYSATCCAERVAVFSAVAAGARKIAAVAIVSDSQGATYPCGVCRQVLSEFAAQAEMPVYCGSAGGQWLETTLDQLLPHAFKAADMPGHEEKE
ncbi:Cytidine deaminase [uncultured Clostridium sp.]|nr:Cytidine deaminase [uncultured Clostridium sp.]